MTIDRLAEEIVRKHNLANARTNESVLAQEFLDLREQVARGGTSAQQEYIASLQEQVARLTAELDGMRKLAADPMCIQKVKNELGPMSLWSKQGLEDHIRRETEKITAERNAFQAQCISLKMKHTMEIERLTAERDALRKDAERYRWLRSRNTGPSQIWELLSDDCNPPYTTLKIEAELDAAIDAARNDKP